MPDDADRTGTPAGVFGAEPRFYRTRAGLSQQDLAAGATISHDVFSKIETGERPPAEDFPSRLDAVPELDTRGALTRLWDHLKKGHKQRRYGWFQQWAGIEARATVLRWYEPLVVPGLLQTEEYARAILSARPDGNLADLDEQGAARLARQAISGRTGAPQLWCILDEGVLHRAIGGSKVMRSQLHRLAEVAEHPKTTRRVRCPARLRPRRGRLDCPGRGRRCRTSHASGRHVLRRPAVDAPRPIRPHLDLPDPHRPLNPEALLVARSDWYVVEDDIITPSRNRSSTSSSRVANVPSPRPPPPDGFRGVR